MKKVATPTTIYFQFDKFLSHSSVKHFCSTRIGGVSQNHLASLNLSFNVGDMPSNVLTNRTIIFSAAGLVLQNFVFANQCHTNNIAIVNETHKGMGAITSVNTIPNTDALITNCRNVGLYISTADCVPVVLFDTEKKIIAAIHAGWRGTVSKITYNTVQKMIKQFNCNPKEIIAGIGPSVCVNCYEVGIEVKQQVLQAFGTCDEFIIEKNKKLYFNLWHTSKHQLIASGLLENNIEVWELCTCCNSKLFFSSRFNNGKTGRNGVAIQLS